MIHIHSPQHPRPFFSTFRLQKKRMIFVWLLAWQNRSSLDTEYEDGSSLIYGTWFCSFPMFNLQHMIFVINLDPT